MRAELHPREAERLAALERYGVMDTPREPEFDEIVSLAAEICGAPVSLIALLDGERQWYKATVGVGDMTGTPLEIAFCAHALLADGPLEIPDLALDPRTADNPLVTDGPRARFYAGHPLVTPEGLPVGTLCVLDLVPRELTDLQRRTLAVLARSVVKLLESRVAVADLERRVEERTAALVAKNAELETFAYSVAHDLRTPLRSIVGHAAIVREDEGDRLSLPGREGLARLEASALRMAHLVDDLLEFARLGRSTPRREAVDLGQLALVAASEVRREHPDAGLVLEIEGDLSATGDPRLLGMALGNLLDNACKYRRPGAPARVALGRDERGFFVRDAGIGFDPAYASKLFVPFERLHREARIPGTGIGLASVRRAVELHGGEVWAEGEAGVGATFGFTLG